MGSFLTGRRLAAPLAVPLATALAATLLLTGCDWGCQPSTRTLALAAPYDRFFSQRPVCGVPPSAPVAASSSTGLTDSYANSCANRYDNSSTGGGLGPCETLTSERRSINEYASLYGFRFVIDVEERPDGPHLLVRDQSTSSAGNSQELTYNFATNRAGLTYRATFSSNPEPFAPAPTVAELANFQSGGRTYAQVWRIANPLNAAQGNATAATVLFVDRDYGLIRFEQRDGTVWTLNR